MTKTMQRIELSKRVAVTVTMVQTIIDCAMYSTNRRQMARSVAKDAGLYPLSQEDRLILEIGIGPERLSTFEDLCR